MKKLFFALGALCFPGALLLANNSNDLIQPIIPQPEPVLPAENVHQLSLEGKWGVTLLELTPEDAEFLPGRLEKNRETGTVNLPGTLDEALLGRRVAMPAYGCLSRRVHYIGPAKYVRQVEIPPSMANQELELYLERVMWRSSVSVDSFPVPGVQESLAVPHVHRLGKLSAGKHQIEILIDNSQIYRIGEKGHAYGEHMQSIWNGAVGKLLIRTVPPISAVRVDAPYPAKCMTVSFQGGSGDYRVSLTPQKVKGKGFEFSFNKVKAQNGKVTLQCAFNAEQPLPWNEFHPSLYTVTITQPSGQFPLYSGTVGFRTFERKGNKLFLNGKPAFLRGNLDNCHFPLTGYPAMNKDQWLDIFNIMCANGVNNIRFHSWCPPQAAFEAADELGVYLAPEAGMWIDGWMPASTFDGKPYAGLGKGDAQLDNFIHSELKRMVGTYANNPSFAMLSVGNELGNSNFNVIGDWLSELKNSDTRFLYSGSTARSITKADDYLVTHSYPGVGGIRQRMESHTDWDYEGLFARTNLPAVAHEIGQWPVYPDWNEIDRYTGVLQARNLEQLRDDAKAKGTFRFNKAFSFASGRQSAMMYKDEIESFMRTPSCAGLHLLGIQDYSGQGEALIGWLNSFYEEKGNGGLTADETKAFFAPSVLLARFKKYVWSPSETLHARIQRHHGGDEPAPESRLVIRVEDADGMMIHTSLQDMPEQSVGSVENVGDYSLSLKGFKPGRYTLRVEQQPLDGTDTAVSPNHWSFWVLPETIHADVPQGLVYTKTLEEALQGLDAGKTVVLNASALGRNGTFFPGTWGAVYWSTTWFPGQAMKTLGLWLDKESPLFRNFGCEGFGDWIWRDLSAGGRAFNLAGLPEFRPWAMPVPDFHLNDRLGTLFALKVGNGILMVSGYDLDKDILQARQLKKNIFDFVSAKDFKPQVSVDRAWVEKTFASRRPVESGRPAKFKDAQIYIECGGKVKQENADLPWLAELDKAELADNFRYEGENVTHWQDKDGSFWVLRKGKSGFTLRFPSGDTGKLFVRFRDPNHNGRIGKGTVEGRPFTVPAHAGNPDGELWMEFDIDREDALDGKLEFRAEPSIGPNLMIDRVVYQSNQKI